MADKEWWDVGMFKETPNGKNFFIKLGSAAPNEDGGFTIYFDALPLPGPKGGCRVSIKPRQSYGGGSRSQSSTGFDSKEAPF